MDTNNNNITIGDKITKHLQYINEIAYLQMYSNENVLFERSLL